MDSFAPMSVPTVAPGPEPSRDPVLPAVSVCVPVHDGERFLARTLRDVLAQTADDLEVVVLDNASTDGTAAVVAAFDDPRVRLERTERLLPLAENWNRAVELARAPLVKIVCADDVLRPECVAVQAAALHADPGLALVIHRQDLVDCRDRVIAPDRFVRGLLGVHDRGSVLRAVVRSGANPIGAPCGVTFRRAAFLACGGMRADRTFLGDLDLWVRLTEHGRLLGGPETLAGFRVVPGSISGRAGAREYAQQRRFSRESAALAPPGAVRWYDVVVGTLGAPLARARRHLLFTLGRWAERGGRAPR